MKKTINKILSIFVLIVLSAAIISVGVVYAHRYIFTAAEGNKQIIFDSGSDILSVDVDYQLSGGGGYVDIKSLKNADDGIVNVAGGVGDPINITAKRRDVETATITFNYNKSGFDEEKANKLGIAYYNEETGRMELLKSDVNTDKGNVSVKTTHFSEYVVVDTDEWYDAWLESQLRIRDAENEDYFNISFVIDNSGSMQGEKNKLSRECTYDFITELYDEDMFSLISFNSSAEVRLSTQVYGQADKNSLKDITESITAGGGTSIDAALECGINELSSTNDATKQRLLILLSDGQSSLNEKYFKEAEAKQVKIITIGFGDDADEALLQKIASENGGKYYKASEKTVKEIFELIREEYLGVDLSIDSDGDKLPDKVETVGMRTQYGYTIRTDAYSNDTDGDGRTDGEEMGTLVVDENVTDEDREHGLTAYVYFKMNSNPLIPDGNTSANGETGAYKEGEFPITFRTETQDSDITYDFYYSDEFFKKNSSEYNNQLAIASLGLELSAFSTLESDNYWTDDNVYISSGNAVRRETNIINAYNTLGFADARFYNYDVSLNDSSDKVAYSFAHKTIKDGNDQFTLITVVTRGGGYGAEWASNFNVGNNGIFHEGFKTASWAVVESLVDYMSDLRTAGTLDDNVKFWVTGYSRGAAVANLTTAVLDEMNSIDNNDVFAYTFATPQGVNIEKYKKYSSQYSVTDYSGIFNIINPGDVVPTVALTNWGFGRFGSDKQLTDTDLWKSNNGDMQKKLIQDATSNFYKITSNEKEAEYASTVEQASFVKEFDDLLYNCVDSSESFNKELENFVCDFLELTNTKEYVNGVEKDILTKFVEKYGEDGVVALYEASSYSWNKNKNNDDDDDKKKKADMIWALTALAELNDIDIDSIMADTIDYASDNILGILVSLVSYKDVKGAHYPEVYLSWLLCQ